jgi:hypothetical protein
VTAPAASGLDSALRSEVRDLLQRLVACDTSNPPGRETQAVAIVEAYLLDALTGRGHAGDASLADTGPNALFEPARLLGRLERYRSPVQIAPEVEALIDVLAPGAEPPMERVTVRGRRTRRSAACSARSPARPSSQASWTPRRR